MSTGVVQQPIAEGVVQTSNNTHPCVNQAESVKADIGDGLRVIYQINRCTAG